MGTNANSVGVRKVLVAYREYTGALRLTDGRDEGANSPAPVAVNSSIREAYLELMCEDRLQGHIGDRSRIQASGRSERRGRESRRRIISRSF